MAGKEIQLAKSCPGYVKVKLQYLTREPTHLRNMLLSQHGIKPPFIEETCVLLPHQRVHPAVECFFPVFETLRQAGAIPEKSELQDFAIIERDFLTLSYIF